MLSLVLASSMPSVIPVDTWDADPVCTPTELSVSSFLWVYSGPGFDYLLVKRPDGVEFWLSYPGPRDGLPLPITSEELGESWGVRINVWTVEAGAPNHPGTPVQRVFSLPGEYTVSVARDLETDGGAIRSCTVTYDSGDSAANLEIQPPSGG